MTKEFQFAPWTNIATIEMNIVNPISFYERKDLTLSGWGNTENFRISKNFKEIQRKNFSFDFPQKLHAVNMKIVKTDAKWDGKTVSPERGLQASQEGGKGVCRGDSGGIKT